MKHLSLVGCRVFRISFCVLIGLLALSDSIANAWAQQAGKEQAPFDFAKATKDVPKPREIWPIVKKLTVPLDFRVKSDKVIASDYEPSKRIRRVEAEFKSQRLGGKTWVHPCVILLPADGALNAAPPRRGKVVIMGSTDQPSFSAHEALYGDRIVSKTDYPTMILSNPGRYEDGSYIEGHMDDLWRLRRETGQNYYNMNCQLAVVYIQAMNAFQEFLQVDHLKAILGGHSKRGRSATVAAAMDDRVASAIIMGNEGVYHTDRVEWHLSFHHAFFQEQVHVPVFYLGATNEDGYKMFNVNILQERLKHPMTVEMIPNYNHSTLSEIQAIDFLMWVSHVFDSRPLSRIENVRHERENSMSVFTAKVTSEAKIQMVRAWYVYTDNPGWRDLMWYHQQMHETPDGFRARLSGKIPDAFMVEVADIAQGAPGYVSSLPQKLTDAPVVERRSQGDRPRLWEPAKRE